MMRVQRSAGNRAAATMVRRRPGTLQVGPADDRYEREADSIASRVVAALQVPEGDVAPDEPVRRTTAVAQPLRRRTARRDESAETGQIGLEGGTVDQGFEQQLRSARAGGAPLQLPVRRRMEHAFGTDFSSVRVHGGGRAAELNDQISAKAFTVGSDIFFRDGVPDTGSRSGQELLAHELTHTLQQGGGAQRQVVQRLFGRKKKTTTTTPTPTPKKSREEEQRDLLGKMKGEAAKAPAKKTTGSTGPKGLHDDVEVENDPFDTAEGVGEALTGPMGSVGAVTDADSYKDELHKAKTGQSTGATGKTTASENDTNAMGVASGTSSFVSMFFGIAKAVNSFKKAEDVGGKIGAVLDGIGAGLSGVAGVGAMADKGSKLTGKYGVDSDGAQKGIEGSKETAGALSGIADAFGGVKEAFFTIKGIVDLVKGANEMTDEEKFKGSMEVIRHALEAAKSSVSAAKSFLDLCGSGVTAAMVNSIPGLGIAIGCADLVVRSVDLIVGAIRTHDMRMKKQSAKTLIGGAKGTTQKTQAEAILKDTSIPDDDPKKEAAKEYLTAKSLQWINQKRANRAILKMSVAMAKIAGDAATLGGASAPVGIGLKVGALALDVGASIFRRFKQWMQNKADDARTARVAAGGKAEDKSTLEKVFNADKSTKNKMTEYNRMVTHVFEMIKAVPAAPPPVDPKVEAQMNKVADYISAMGYSLKAMERDFKKDATGGKVRSNMIDALKKRE
jgi:hypothetical protein